METGLFQLADHYFLCHQELVAHLSYADMVSIKNEPFIIKSSVVGGKGFRTISEQLVPYLMRYSGENCIHYFFSPQAAAKLTLPVMPAVDLHRHHYFELFGILDGQLDIRMEHTNKRYYPGEFCLLNQSVFHSEQFTDNYSAIYISIRPDLFEILMSGPDAAHYETFRRFAKRNQAELGDDDSLDFSVVNSSTSAENLRTVDGTLSIILTELIGRHTGYMDIVTGQLKRLMAHLQHPDNFTCVNTQYPAEKADICQAALSYIHQNRRKITRKELGAAINYNCNYLADIFHRQMGISLSAYIRDICMQEAARLLLNTSCPIHTIAAKVGYENRTVFYQHFLDKYGMTPKNFRRNDVQQKDDQQKS